MHKSTKKEEIQEIISNRIFRGQNEATLPEYINNYVEQSKNYLNKGEIKELNAFTLQFGLKTKTLPINLLEKKKQNTIGIEFLSYYQDEKVFKGSLFNLAKKYSTQNYIRALEIIALWRIIVCIHNGYDDKGNPIIPVPYYHINLTKETIQEIPSGFVGTIATFFEIIQKKFKRATTVFEISEQMDDLNDILNIDKLKNHLNPDRNNFNFAWDNSFSLKKGVARVPVLHHLQFHDIAKFIKVDYKFFHRIYNNIGFFKPTIERMLEFDPYCTAGTENCIIIEGIENNEYRDFLRQYTDKCLIQGLDVFTL